MKYKFIKIKTILLILMLIVPISMTPYISAKKLYIVLGDIAIAPIIFFAIGALWLINWIDSSYEDVKFTNITILFLMFVTAGFCLEFNDISSLVLLEILFISLLIYINSLKSWVIATIFSFFSLAVLYASNIDHPHIIKINNKPSPYNTIKGTHSIPNTHISTALPQSSLYSCPSPIRFNDSHAANFGSYISISPPLLLFLLCAARLYKPLLEFALSY